MNNISPEFIWLDQRQQVSLDELVELTGLLHEDLKQLVENGALTPSGLSESEWSFSCHCVTLVRALSRLKEDFELEPNSLGLLLKFLERIEKLELRLNELEQNHMIIDSKVS